MSTPSSGRQTFLCPNCGAKFEFGGNIAGRSGKCRRCGHLFTVPASTATAVATTAPKPASPPAPSRPQFISIACRVCQTRLSGRPDQVGKPLKCPDCGAMTVLKSPDPVKPKSLPSALEGAQYELWDADDAPLPSELIATQPKYVAVTCRLCGTLMHATADQIGTKLKCPDCGSLSVVSPLAEPRVPREVLVSDSEAYQLDEAFAPVERPPVIRTEYKGMLYEQEREAERARETAKAASGKPPRQRIDVRGRPILPRWPLLTGVLPFLFSRGVLVRWAALFAFGALDAAITAMSLPGLRGIGGSVVENSMGAISGVYFLMFSFVIGFIWLAALASIVITTITESSEGNAQISRWPTPVFTEWLGELAYLVIAGCAGAVPGGLIAQFSAANSPQRALWIAGSLWLCFPVAMLSQLDISSPFAVLSGTVLTSLARCPFSWLLFYVETGLLATVCVLATVFAGQLVLVLTLVIPLSIVAVFLYARLLGRLAWKLAETMPGAESSRSDEA
jgi:DNA-directed RNA polymerase subunit RPC12/RpoP